MSRTRYLTKEEKEAIIEQEKLYDARTKFNLCYILADVMDSYLTDAIPQIEKAGMMLKHEERRKFNNFISTLKQAKARLAGISTLVYMAEGVEDSIEEIDKMAELILLISDRTGPNDQPVMNKIANYIRKFKSKKNLKV